MRFRRHPISFDSAYKRHGKQCKIIRNLHWNCMLRTLKHCPKQYFCCLFRSEWLVYVLFGMWHSSETCGNTIVTFVVVFLVYLFCFENVSSFHCQITLIIRMRNNKTDARNGRKATTTWIICTKQTICLANIHTWVKNFF